VKDQEEEAPALLVRPLHVPLLPEAEGKVSSIVNDAGTEPNRLSAARFQRRESILLKMIGLARPVLPAEPKGKDGGVTAPARLVHLVQSSPRTVLVHPAKQKAKGGAVTDPEHPVRRVPNSPAIARAHLAPPVLIANVRVLPQGIGRPVLVALASPRAIKPV